MLKQDQTSSGLERHTCVCGRALVKQPWMMEDKWRKSLREFTKKHSACRESEYVETKTK